MKHSTISLSAVFCVRPGDQLGPGSRRRAGGGERRFNQGGSRPRWVRSRSSGLVAVGYLGSSERSGGPTP